MLKYFRSCGIVAVLLLSSAAVAFADIWDGTVDVSCDLTQPTISINSAAQLAYVAQQSAATDFSGKTIVLTADLDLDNRPWAPIGSKAKPFAGTFDGAGHQITNVKVAGSDYVGFFGAIGTAGAVSGMAIINGVFEGDSYVGSLAGSNAGRVAECFAMSTVEYKNGRAGGLIGSNEGVVSYVYTTGRLWKRQSAAGYAGGLVGENSGTISDGYSLAFVDGERAAGLVGNNTGTLERLYCDQQMSNPNQQTVYSGSAAGTNPGTTTTMLTKQMYGIFPNDNRWTTQNSYYPELTTFAGRDFSLVSVVPVVFYDAVCAGAVKVVNKYETFDLKAADKRGTALQWASDPQVDATDGPITFLGETTAKFKQRCEKKEVRLTVTLGTAHKDIYMVVAGYDNFDPGAIKQSGSFDFHNSYCFGKHTALKIESAQPAVGGNEQYFYKFTEYKIEKDENGDIDTIGQRVLDNGNGKSATLSNYFPTGYGTYMIVRSARDGLCQTAYLPSAGAVFLTVLPPPDAGAIDSTMSVYRLSGNDSLEILSLRDASIDTAVYDEHRVSYNKLTYAWNVYYCLYDWATGDSIEKMTLIAQSDTLRTDTSTLILDAARPGEYVIYRYVVSDCNQKELFPAEGKVRLIVFDPFESGCIDGDSVSGRRVMCNADLMPIDSIASVQPPSGGSGVYQYRWTLDGVPLSDADSAYCLMDLSQLPAGVPMVVRREVRDTIAQRFEWQASADSVTYILYPVFDEGAVEPLDTAVCLSESEQSVALSLPSVAPASGGNVSDIVYRWVLEISCAGTTTTTTDTLHHAEATDNYTLDLTAVKQFPLSVTAVRQVTDGACQAEYVASRDTVRYRLSRESVQAVPLLICEEQLPYVYTHTLADGTEHQVSFRTANDTILVDDVNIYGCALHLKFYVMLRGTTSIDVSDAIYSCQTDDSLSISINSPVGSLQQYTLYFDEAGQQAGFESKDLADLPSDLNIPIALPDNVRPGIYKAYLQFSDGTNDAVCASAVYEITVSVGAAGYLHTKWNDVIFVDNNDKNGQPEAESDLSFTAFQWYKDGELVSGATESYYHESGGLNGVYHAVVTTAAGETMRLCAVEVRPGTGLDRLLSDDFAVCPTLVEASAPLLVLLPDNSDMVEVYSVMGRFVASYSVPAGVNRIEVPAPSVRGVYLLRTKTQRGTCYTVKLIVR